MLHPHAKHGLLVMAAAMLSACSHAPVPLAENFQLTTQKKVRSAGHWDILSKDVVERTSAKLAGVGLTRTSALTIQVQEGPTAFEKAFGDFLVTGFVNAGQRVVPDARNADVRVSYKVQIVEHKSHRPHFIPGVHTALAGGLMAAYELGSSYSSAAPAVAGAVVVADLVAGQYSGGPTHHELILTTTVERGGLYLARSTDVYYVEGDDTGLFLPPPPPAPVAVQPMTMRVVGQ